MKGNQKLKTKEIGIPILLIYPSLKEKDKNRTRTGTTEIGLGCTVYNKEVRKRLQVSISSRRQKIISERCEDYLFGWIIQ